MSMDEENGRTQWAEVKSASVGRYDVLLQYRDIVIFTTDGPRAGFGPFLAVRCAGDDTQSCPVPLEDVMDGVEVIDGWKRRWEGRMTASGSRDGDIVMVSGRPILAPDTRKSAPRRGRQFADAPGTCARCVRRSLGG